MSQGIELTTMALHDILEVLAEGLNDAQNQLRSMPPYDAFGRPNTMYQLPYLDFNLQVTTEIEITTTTENVEKRILRFTPAPISQNTSNVKTEVFSTISGRFLATFPNEGLPQMVLEVKTGTPKKGDAGYDTEIEVMVGNTSGERHVNSKVEFNYDPELTKSMNATAVSGTPIITVGEVYTSIDGKSTSVFKIPSADYEAGKIFVFVINVGTVEKIISIGK